MGYLSVQYICLKYASVYPHGPVLWSRGILAKYVLVCPAPSKHSSQAFKALDWNSRPNRCATAALFGFFALYSSCRVL